MSVVVESASLANNPFGRRRITRSQVTMRYLPLVWFNNALFVTIVVHNLCLQMLGTVLKHHVALIGTWCNYRYAHESPCMETIQHDLLYSKQIVILLEALNAPSLMWNVFVAMLLLCCGGGQSFNVFCEWRQMCL